MRVARNHVCELEGHELPSGLLRTSPETAVERRSSDLDKDATLDKWSKELRFELNFLIAFRMS